MGGTKYVGKADEQPSESRGPAGGGVFISHATVDKELVDALVDLLQTGMELPRERIFCTSLEGLGIPEGRDFVDFIREKLSGAEHVIMVISPRYFESPFCLCELGATWVLSGDAFPLIVPPLGFPDLKAVLSGVQAGMINNPATLDNLCDRLNKAAPRARWNVKRDAFLRRFEREIAPTIAGPSRIAVERHEALQQQYDEAIAEVSDKDSEIRVLRQQIEELKALKDRAEVAEVTARYTDDQEHFEILVEEVKAAFRRLPSIAVEALYYEERGDPFIVKTGFDRDDSRLDAARSAEQNGYIAFHDSEVSLNHDDRKVRQATAALSELREFLSGGASGDFNERFDNEHEFPADLSNRRFWTHYLDL